MKKILRFLMIGVIAVACDTIGYDKFIVVNNCDEDISVNVDDDPTLQFVVMAKNEHLFHISEGIPAKWPDIVENIFKQITITKNGKVSHKNYVDKTEWKYVDVDDAHSEWYLYINSEDFGDE